MVFRILVCWDGNRYVYGGWEVVLIGVVRWCVKIGVMEIIEDFEFFLF